MNQKKKATVQSPKIPLAITPLLINDELEQEERYFSMAKVTDCKIYAETSDKVIFEQVVFNNVSFENTTFRNVEFTDVIFEKCDLSNVDFSDAILLT
ncbi:pentapeptide repeat-containing protein [Bacillus canaveralius]|uniref:pentapeptide repeat-containing protein n=1 Tax=Bacillus canaveralius TaxID=1403243 RepID=UPI000F7B26BD|nr:pentapeptide repeat-containing protein [Bacillus canaveralius]RSK53982.1 hypothetical protein EJA13_07110 [Bacillus canaveralius]